MYSVALSITIGDSDAKFRLTMMNTLRTTSESNNLSPPEQMRREIINNFGANNVLLGYQVGWALAALQLLVSAERVVNL